MVRINLYNQGISSNQRSVRLLFNLSEKIRVNHTNVQPYEIFVANSGEQLEVFPLSNKLAYAIIDIDEQTLSQNFRVKDFLFSIDSSQIESQHYKQLKKCLTNLLLTSSEDDFSSRAEFHYYSYELYLLLMRYFRVTSVSIEDMSLSDQLQYYILEHFREEISLSTISSDFYMTPQYFSKIFKKEMGETFHKYLTQIRVNHAKQLLRENEGSLLTIALDSGFSNSSAFNRIFKEKEHMSPSDYRKVHAIKTNPAIKESNKELSKLLNDGLPSEDDSKGSTLEIDTKKRFPVDFNWQTVCNIGNINALSSELSRTQFKEYIQEIKAEYLRFELTFPEDAVPNYDFYREESNLDFLIRLGFKCQIVIDFREFNQKPHFEEFLRQFIAYFSNRYSINRVQQWRFELNYETLFNPQKCLDYNQSYQRISKVLKQFNILESLFGPGFVMGDYTSFKCFMKMVSNGDIAAIEHVTFLINPDIADQKEKQVILRTVTDQDHVKNQLDILHQLIDTYQLDMSMHIVEWSALRAPHSWLNDTTFKAANIVRNILACYQKVSDIAWEIPLDVLTSNYSSGLLSGKEGTITRHGIRKPSFYAQSFLNRHGEEFLVSNPNTLVTSSGNNISILSHHCADLNYRYYLENTSNYEESDFFESCDSKKIKYCLKNLKPGTYLIKTRVINSSAGSIKELSRQVFGDDSSIIGDSEVDFLKSQAIPKLSLSKRNVTQGDLSLSIDMAINEIRHTHIIYLYES